MRGVNDLFTRICEIDGHQFADPRLHLPDPPFGVGGVSDKHAGSEDKIGHMQSNTGPREKAQSTFVQDDHLGAMIASRICHDLISPMGAIGNGLELLQLSQGVTGPEIDLITQSITHANTRLRLYRLAFGMVGEEQMISRAEIASLLQALSAQGRHSYRWVGTGPVNRRQSKLTVLLLLCLESAFPWGGEIVISDMSGGLQLTATSDRMKLEDDLWNMLGRQESAENVTASKVQFALLARELQEQSASVTKLRDGNVLTLYLRYASHDHAASGQIAKGPEA